jgi:hypothetical protein
MPWPNAGSPKFQRDPFARDVLYDPGRVGKASRSGLVHVAFDLTHGLCPCDQPISWLDHTPHSNRCVRFVAGVTVGSRNTRYQAACSALPGPDLHRLIAPALLGAFG